MRMTARNQQHDCLEKNYFGRSIDDVVNHNFFKSFDANIYQHSDHYLIAVAVPGFRKKELSIHINDSILLVTASKEEREPDSSGFSYTSFNRSFVLPPDVDVSRVNASCRDGILRIRLTRIANRAIGRTIPVTDGNRVYRWWNCLLGRLRHWLSF
jgi:HSP20 family protein